MISSFYQIIVFTSCWSSRNHWQLDRGEPRPAHCCALLALSASEICHQTKTKSTAKRMDAYSRQDTRTISRS